MPDAPSIQILVTPDFQGQLRKLAKRYRNIRFDLQPLFDDLERGNCPDDQIPGTTYTVFKVRVKNSDIQKVFIADAFKREARNIESDLQALIEQLQNSDLPGERIPGFADYIVHKVRVKNSDKKVSRRSY